LELNALESFVENTWDVGKVTGIRRFTNGVTNLQYKVTCQKEGAQTCFALKRYEGRVSRCTVEYEHALMHHLKKYSGGMTSVPIYTRAGNDYIRSEDEGRLFFWGLFTFLPGASTYTWLYTRIPDVSIRSCGEAGALFHTWGNDFLPDAELACQQENVLSRFSRIPEELARWIPELEKEHTHPYFVGYLKQYQSYFESEVKRLDALLREVAGDLPECTIHQDMNQGNFMFGENGKVSAVLDLDWAVHGKRLYDVAWMAQQMLSSWEEASLGEILADKLPMYLEAYNRTAEGSLPGPLTKTECEFLPEMMAITELIVIRDFVDLVYTNRGFSDILYYFYLWRYRRMLVDTAEKRDLIRKAADQARR
jgi:Ser/Thr protein kinase RdoA (MazF antagonist)